jgi:hypothetical protein
MANGNQKLTGKQRLTPRGTTYEVINGRIIAIPPRKTAERVPIKERERPEERRASTRDRPEARRASTSPTAKAARPAAKAASVTASKAAKPLVERGVRRPAPTPHDLPKPTPKKVTRKR